MKTIARLPFLSIVAAIVAVSSAHADTAYPEKPIRIIVPFSAGGATDMLARTVGQHLTERWGQTVIVENRPGAGGNIGASAGARAAPDGYTLTLTAAGISAVNPHVYKDLTYDSIESFAPITQLVAAPLLLALHPSVEIDSAKQWIEEVRANPEKYTVANGGVGTAQHLGAEYLDMEAKMKSLHVPYNGSAPATTDVLGGQTQAILDNMVTLMPHIKSNKLKALAVTSTERTENLPDVPTFSESGLPGFQTGTWYGVVAPAGTPDEVIQKLQVEIADILTIPALRQTLVDQGLIPVGNTPEEFAEVIRSDREKMGIIVKAADIQMN